ncbi:YlbD family protein [Bacillus tuaregi]|uniref:YlbD family protein n=1 Tax=Bacillus tuaregi TaxID=1816695 RepID=UPI0008F86152|nr:YlbD family protein [Bacillus tuaregi]
MENKKLHPSIEEFKAFVNKNPRVLVDVKKGKTTLQELYEDWYLLGENDSKWDRVSSEADHGSKESKGDWLSNVLGAFKKMDQEQLQHNINHLSQAIGAVQGVLAQFQAGANKNKSNPQTQKQNNPFIFRKD